MYFFGKFLRFENNYTILVGRILQRLGLIMVPHFFVHTIFNVKDRL